MQPLSPLVRELLRLASERGWSRSELAARLRVHPTLLAHVQAGRRRLTVDVLARALRAFGEVQSVRDFVMNYLLVEVPAMEAAEGGTGRRRAAPTDTGLSPAARAAVNEYLGSFVRSFYEGKGLFLTGADTSQLRAAARALVAGCEERRIPVLVTDANVKLSSTFLRAALRTSLVVVGRVDFASPSVVELLVRRADLVKPSVVTSGGGIAAIPDAHLARIIRSMMRVVELSPAPSLPDTIHA